MNNDIDFVNDTDIICSTLYDTYIFNATTSNDRTVTLPPIKCDGMRFKIIRIDNKVDVFLSVISSNNILVRGNVVSSINIEILSTIIFISYSNSWYLLSENKNIAESNKSKFCGVFTSNQGDPYSVYSGNQTTPETILTFPYFGSNISPINYIFLVYSSNGVLDTTFELIKPDNTIVGQLSFTTVDTGPPDDNQYLNCIPIQFTSINQILLPQTESNLIITNTRNNANGKSLYLFSILIA